MSECPCLPSARQSESETPVENCTLIVEIHRLINPITGTFCAVDSKVRVIPLSMFRWEWHYLPAVQ